VPGGVSGGDKFSVLRVPQHVTATKQCKSGDVVEVASMGHLCIVTMQHT